MNVIKLKVNKCYVFAFVAIIVSILLSFSAYGKEGDWEFIINTPDGTPQTGSKENTVGFDKFNLYRFSSIDKELEELKDHNTYTESSSMHNEYRAKVENGSLRIYKGYDLYVYDGVAFNGKTGAAYSKGYYFTITWRFVGSNSMDFSEIANLDPLSYVEKFAYDDDSGLKGTAASFYTLVMILAGPGMVLSLILAGIKIMRRGVKSLKEDLLEVLGYKLLVFMALCSFVSLFGLFGKLVEAILL